MKVNKARVSLLTIKEKMNPNWIGIANIENALDNLDVLILFCQLLDMEIRFSKVGKKEIGEVLNVGYSSNRYLYSTENKERIEMLKKVKKLINNQ